MMLDLSHPAWKTLQGPYGSSERVPELIRLLQQNYDEEVKDELYWEYLFHQNTLYSCTYASVPYLVEIAHRTTDMSVKLDIYVTCGIFEASNTNDLQCEIPAELMLEQDVLDEAHMRELSTTYRSAIASLRDMSQSMIDFAKMSVDPTEKRYIVAADAAFQGNRDIASMLITFSEGEEYIATCQACEADLYLWPNESNSELLVYKDDPTFHGTEQPISIQVCHPERDTVEDARLRTLYQQTAAIQERTLLTQLPFLAGETDCPACGAKVQIWPGVLHGF